MRGGGLSPGSVGGQPFFLKQRRGPFPRHSSGQAGQRIGAVRFLLLRGWLWAQPFSGCRLMPVDNPISCLTFSAGQLRMAPCSSAAAQGQAWNYDGKTNVNAQGKCLDISVCSTSGI